MGLDHPSGLEEAETQRPLLVAALIIKENKLLLVFNVKKGLRIEPSGGKVKPGETLHDAVKREVHEEINWEVEVGELLGVYPTQTPEGVFDCHMFFCTHTGGELVLKEKGKIEHAEWFTIDELKEMAVGRTVLVPNLVASLPDLERHFKS